MPYEENIEDLDCAVEDVFEPLLTCTVEGDDRVHTDGTGGTTGVAVVNEY